MEAEIFQFNCGIFLATSAESQMAIDMLAPQYRERLLATTDFRLFLQTIALQAFENLKVTQARQRQEVLSTNLEHETDILSTEQADLLVDIYNRFQASAVLYVQRLIVAQGLEHVVLAEEVVTEVILRIAKRGLREGGNLQSYLFTSIRHALRDAARKSARERELFVSGVTHSDLAQSDLEPASDAELVFELVHRNELTTVLRSGIRSLPTLERTVIVEHFIRETPIQQVADQLALQPSDVRGVVHNGLSQLRYYLMTKGYGSWSDACLVL